LVCCVGGWVCGGVCVFVLGGGDGGEGGVMQPPRPRRVALTRTFPGQWSLYVFEEDDQRYQLLQSVRVCSRCHELPQTSLYDSIFCSGGSSSTRLVCWHTSTVYNPLCFHVSRLVNVCVFAHQQCVGCCMCRLICSQAHTHREAWFVMTCENLIHVLHVDKKPSEGLNLIHVLQMDKKPSERLVLQICARALTPKPE